MWCIHAWISLAGDRKICGREFELIAGRGPRVVNDARRQFNDGMRRKARRKAPGSYRVPDFFYLFIAVDVDQIDRELHEKGVDGLAGDDPQTFP